MRTIFILLLSLSLAAPALADVSRQDEETAGKSSDKLIREHFGVYKDERVQAYVKEVAEKLLATVEDPEFTFTFTVLDDPMLNAFALPGGFVYITRGMLAYLDSEAALAGVLGHEIGHVIGHHSYKAMQKSLKDALLVIAGMGAGIAAGSGTEAVAAWATASSQISAITSAGYGRDLEMQSDEFGMIYAYDAGYDPREHARFFRMMQFKEQTSGAGYHGFMASHPDTIERIVRAREKGDILVNRGKPSVVRREEYLTRIEGLAFGDGNRRAKLEPDYVLKLYRTKEGDDFRSIAREVSEEEALAFELAMLNNMREKDKIPAGCLLKAPVKRSATDSPSPAGAPPPGSPRGPRR